MFMVGPNPPHISNIGVNSLPFWLLQISKKNCNKQIAVEDTVGRPGFFLATDIVDPSFGPLNG